jgi:mitotic spindle assembly checkpoint protein MAD2
MQHFADLTNIVSLLHVCHFLLISTLCSILYQRGIYDPATFTAVQKYGIRLQVTTDQGLASYLQKVLTQMEEWLQNGQIKKLVLVITGVEKGEVLER